MRKNRGGKVIDNVALREGCHTARQLLLILSSLFNSNTCFKKHLKETATE